MADTYKCPKCGAPLEFSGIVQSMHCDYCDSDFNVSEIDKEHTMYDKEVVDETDNVEKEYCEFDGYKCESCGAEIVTDENTTATFCSFCGSPALIKDRLSNALKPELVVPFKIDKEGAKTAYRKWTGKGLITPSGFRKESTIEKITGIYVPFWLYDYDTDCNMVFHATKKDRKRSGDTEYIYTHHYNVARHVEADYARVPADASEKMDDRTMDLLEPYDYSSITAFQMPYLSGYQSEKYTYDQNQMAERAEVRIRHYIEQETRNTVTGYGSVEATRRNIQLRRKKAAYTLMPVWMLNYTYKGKKYTFAMNGQTGKVVGKLPKSFGKMAAWFGGIFAASFGILMLMGGIFG